MATAASVAAIVDLCAAFIAVEIFSTFLAPQLGAAPPSPQAALLDSAVGELLLPLVALGVLVTAAAAVYRHLQHPAAAAGAAGGRRLYRLFSVLCASVGTLEFFFFVYPAGPPVGGDVGVLALALGLAAARVLPAAATATFFLGMALIIVAHIRAGGEGGGGGAFAADAVSFLTKTAFAAAAALICLTVTAWALCVCGDTGMYTY